MQSSRQADRKGISLYLEAASGDVLYVGAGDHLVVHHEAHHRSDRQDRGGLHETPARKEMKKIRR